MKKITSILLILSIIFCAFMSGCKDETDSGKKKPSGNKDTTSDVSSETPSSDDTSSDESSDDSSSEEEDEVIPVVEDDGIMRFKKIVKPIIKATKPDSGAFKKGQTLQGTKNRIKNIKLVTDTKLTEEKWEMEMDIPNLPADLNVYREDNFDLSIKLTHSTGEEIVMPGFYFQDYTYRDNGQQVGINGAPDFRIRFTLPDEGTWDFEITLKIKGQLVDSLKGYVNATRNSDTRGFMSVEPNRKQVFMFEDGTPYTVIGQNNCTSPVQDGPASMKSALLIERNNKAAQYGSNYTRFWVNHPWSISIQSTGKAPDDLSGGNAGLSHTDKVIDALVEDDMYMSFCMFSFNHFTRKVEGQSAWDISPYYTKNGGYLELPAEFFTDEKAIDDTKQLFRYYVARWGYSRNIMAWEFFNEVDLTEGDPDAIRQWHVLMSDYLREIDPYNHMITTSTANMNDKLNENITFDFMSLHWYNYGAISKISEAQKTRWQLYKKPVIFGEIGLNQNVTFSLDADLINFHQQNWAGLMGGGGGTATNWFWTLLDRVEGYWDYQVVSEMANHIPWYDPNMYMVGTNNVSPSNKQVEVLGYRGKTYAYLWLYDSKFSHINKNLTNFDPVEITVKLKDGKYQVRWINSWTGVSMGKIVATAVDGELTIKTPKWNKDIAVAITRD